MSDHQSEIDKILDWQRRIDRRLKSLGFVEDEAAGNIIHHLAEVSLFGERLKNELMPKFLDEQIGSEEFGEIIVNLNYELTEIKEAIEDMEPAMLRLMNFLTK
jgi:hypothetical protein